MSPEPSLNIAMAKLLKLYRQESEATAIEYAPISALIAVAATGAMQALDSKLNMTYNNVPSNY